MSDFFDDSDSGPTNLSGASTPVDRRRNARHVTVLRVAKLRTDYGEELCLVRNISSTGLMAHIYSTLEVGDPITAEFKSGQSVPGKIAWRREGMIGVQFNRRVDAAAILSNDDRPPAEEQYSRPPRVKMEVRARMRIGARYSMVTLIEISQGGANIRTCEAREMDERVVLLVNGLPPIEGSVRWQEGENVGIAFDVPVRLDALASWVATTQRRLHTPGGAPGDDNVVPFGPPERPGE